MISEEQIYKCSVCGNTVKVLVAGGGTLVCCNKPMDLKDSDYDDLDQKFLGDDELEKIDKEDLMHLDADTEDEEDDLESEDEMI